MAKTARLLSKSKLPLLFRFWKETQFYAWDGFLFSQFSPIVIAVLSKKIKNFIEDIDFWTVNIDHLVAIRSNGNKN